jgi:selenocysteine-specific elongation factor
MYVIGTAGHVDHGKSALVEALTGIHPDRLREERERGLTIELGFAWMTLPSGREVSIVDVPGHVRFVRHMLAGVGAIDLALFVVAADEGVMPQTREHLEILDLLGVRHAVVALTKVDLAPDEEWLALVEEELRELLAPTTLAGAPVVHTSATTGAGLDELRAVLDEALAGVPEPRDVGRPRFGIDRVFTMAGFGTVVTGTLLDGVLRVGETLEAVPDGPTARIRGLQTHQQEVEEAQPGTRVAINLAGVATEQLRRGQVLAPPGQVTPARTIDAVLRALPGRPLRHNLRVTVHLGAAETQGRLRVLAGDEVPGGAEGWCQIQLTPPIAAARGDLFVVRVSDRTLAGGRVLAVDAERHRRTDPTVIERLRGLAEGSPEGAALAALERIEPATAEEIAALADLDASALGEALEGLVASGEAVALAGAQARYLSGAGLGRLRTRAERALETYEREHPLRLAISNEELRARLGLEPAAFEAVLPALAPAIVTEGGGARRAGWTPQPTAAQRRAAEQAVALLVAGGASPPRVELDPELVRYLEQRSEVVDCGDGVIFAAAPFAQARDAVVALIEGQGSATLAQARDALGTNRRAAQALLERLDRDGVTQRRGDERVLARATA